MKKSRGALLFLLSVLAIAAAGCDKLNYVFDLTDYTVDDYSKSHVMVIRKSTNTIVIDEQVVDYEWEGPYLVVLRMPAVSKDCWKDGARMIVTFYSDHEEYWAIDTQNHVTSGPMGKADFNRFVTEKGLGFVRLSVPKDYVASSTEYMARFQDCAADIN